MLVCGSISSRAGRHLSGRLHGRLAAPAADPAASARSPRSSRHARPSASADALCAVWRLSWALKRWQSRGPSVGERASPILMPASARGARAGCVNRRRSSAGSQCATVRRWTGPRRIRRGLRRRYGRQALRTAICTARILGMLPGHRLHQVLSPTVGISEGPTTGTAAGPLVAALVASGRAADNITVVVEQGYCAGAAQQDSGLGVRATRVWPWLPAGFPRGVPARARAPATLPRRRAARRAFGSAHYRPWPGSYSSAGVCLRRIAGSALERCASVSARRRWQQQFSVIGRAGVCAAFGFGLDGRE